MGFFLFLCSSHCSCRYGVLVWERRIWSKSLTVCLSSSLCVMENGESLEETGRKRKWWFGQNNQNIYISTNICFIHSVQIGPYYCVHCHKEMCSFLTIYTTIVCVAVVYRYFRINWVLGGLNYINTLLLNEFRRISLPTHTHRTT